MAMHLSYSQINLFKECSRLWQGSYRLNRKQVGDNNLVFGSAAHKVVENRVAGNPETENILAYWEKVWWGEFAVQPNIAWHLSQDECYDIGKRIFSSSQVLTLIDQVEPYIMKGQPVIERKIEWHLDGLPTVVGYIDCIASDGVPIDFKTAASMWSPGQAKREMQPLFYLAALDSLGEHEHQYRFRHLVITKGAFPVARVFETTRTVEQIAEMKQTVLDVWAQISTGEFPANPSSWLCNPACRMLDRCQEGQDKWFGENAEQVTNVIEEM